MNDRIEMLEATLDLMDEAVAILDCHSHVLFWNKAASELTGYLAGEVIARRCPEGLYCGKDTASRFAAANRILQRGHAMNEVAAHRAVSDSIDSIGLLDLQPRDDPENAAILPTLVSIQHKSGHTVPGRLRRSALHDSEGEWIGTALLFYAAEEVDALPHGDAGGSAEVERSQAEMEDRLEAAHHQWKTAGMPLGLLWINVDQADSLRRTHGRDACEAMLRTVEQTLLRQLKPAEILGRWGNNEFLVLAHERSAELLVEHARRLAGVARTADFRWWGDRVGLTVSIGASHAAPGDSLQTLLGRARQGMRTSAYAGGNQATAEAREI